MHYNYPINNVNENHFKWKKQVNKMYNGMIMPFMYVGYFYKLHLCL